MSMSHKDTKLNDLIKGTSGKARVINELKQALTTHKINDSEVEGKWKQLENYVKDTLMGKIYIEELKQALTTPKISDSEYEELFMLFEEDYMRQTYDRFGVNETYQLKDDKDWNQLKTKFQQMQQEIQDLKIDNYQQKNLINKYHNIDFPDLRKQIENLEGNNQQYKHLLDKIEIKEIDNPKCTLVNGVMVGESLVNIIKELKSIGGNK